jgi:hypothetical protein
MFVGRILNSILTPAQDSFSVILLVSKDFDLLSMYLIFRLVAEYVTENGTRHNCQYSTATRLNLAII